MRPACRRGLAVARRGGQHGAEAGLLGVPDEGHLAYAWSQGRVIVTQDADFLRLHAAGARHAGIVYCAAQVRSLGEQVRLLIQIWELFDPAQLRGHVEFM